MCQLFVKENCFSTFKACSKKVEGALNWNLNVENQFLKNKQLTHNKNYNYSSTDWKWLLLLLVFVVVDLSLKEYVYFSNFNYHTKECSVIIVQNIKKSVLKF